MLIRRNQRPALGLVQLQRETRQRRFCCQNIEVHALTPSLNGQDLQLWFLQSYSAVPTVLQEDGEGRSATRGAVK